MTKQWPVRGGICRRLGALLFVGLLPLGGRSLADERADLQPEPVRWQTYPASVRDVVIDQDGRPWFATDEPATLDEMKSQVEQSCKLAAPWVPGAQVHFDGGAQILHFDRAGRIWLLPAPVSKVLLGYDRRRERWIERPVVPERERGGYDERDPQSPAVIFTETVHESRSGQLYFGDRLGVHVLDQETWSYRPLFRTNIDDGLYFSEHKAFNKVRFAEDDDGNVYVWATWGDSGWSGTVGYFVHDGRTWRQITMDDDGDRLLQVDHLIPLRGDRALVFPVGGSARIVSSQPRAAPDRVDDEVRRLGAGDFTEREAAQLRLARRGSHILSQLKRLEPQQTDPEVVFRLRNLIRRYEQETVSETLVDGRAIFVGRWLGNDGADRTIFWASRVVEPSGEERAAKLWLASSDGRIASAPAALGQWPPGNCNTLVDRHGRLWLARLHHGSALWDGQKLTTILEPTENVNVRLLGEDRDGRVYMMHGSRVVAVDLSRSGDEKR